ncbi:MAG TPA: helix-turn-helix domain-containing protein [Pyrinomonadaceae bacterium]|nr:helix-turn-helix domain-containing protein [Pyrinomonadaceae bacterium]
MHKHAQIEANPAGRQDKVYWRFKVGVLEDLSNTLLEELRSFSKARSIDVGGGINFYDEVHRFECDLIARALRHTGGNQRKAARLIGLKATTLNAKLKHYGLSAAEISSLSDGLIPPDSPDLPHADEGGGTSNEAVDKTALALG